MLKLTLSGIAGSLLALGLNTAAPAQPARVFVAAQGLDGNPCTFSAPCRTFQHAHDVVAAGGEIDVLDPAGYGALTINKSISIQGHDFSGITVPNGGTGISINAAATDTVSLRGLIIEGAGGGIVGISFVAGKTLVIESCVIRNISVSGVMFLPNNISSSLEMSNTMVAKTGSVGVWLQPLNAGVVHAVLARVEVYDSGGTGILADGTAGTIAASINASVADSVVAGNAVGVNAQSVFAATTVDVLVLRSVIANNGQGLNAESDAIAKLRVAQSAVTGNGTGWATVGSATVQSYADNYIDGNSAGNTAPPPIPRK